MDCYAFDTHVGIRASSQYKNFNFGSMVKFNGVCLGTNENGLFRLAGDTDDGVDIDAEFELVDTDLGVQSSKHLRFLYFGFIADGDMEVDVKADGQSIRTIAVSKLEGQRRSRVSPGSDVRGLYFSQRVRNTKGCSFSIYSIEALPVILHRGHV